VLSCFLPLCLWPVEGTRDTFFLGSCCNVIRGHFSYNNSAPHQFLHVFCLTVMQFVITSVSFNRLTFQFVITSVSFTAPCIWFKDSVLHFRDGHTEFLAIIYTNALFQPITNTSLIQEVFSLKSIHNDRISSSMNSVKFTPWISTHMFIDFNK